MSRDDEELSHSESDSDSEINDAIPYVIFLEQGAKVGIKPTIYGVSEPQRNVRLVTPGMENYLTDEKRSLGGFNVTFRENLKIGRTDFQILQWLMYPASHRRSDPWRVYYCPGPVITSPSNNNALVAPNTVFAGRGAAPGANVRVLENVVNGRVYGSDNAREDGIWWVNVNDLPERAISLKVVYVVEGVESDPSTITVNVATAPSITSPKSGELVSDPRPEVSGTGSDGTVVTVFREGGTGGAFGTVTVTNGVWKVKLTQDLPEGAFIFIAQATLGGQHVGWSTPVPVTVQFPSNAPVITGPQANSVQDLTFTLAGNNGKAGAKVEIYEDFGSNKLAESGVLTGENWSVPVTVAPGLISLVALQRVGGGTPSARSLPRLFKIRPARLVPVNVTPLPNEQVKFSGAGYTGATVEITKVSGPGEHVLPPVTVANSRWEVTAGSWVPGSYILSARQKVSDNAGGWIVSEDYQFAFTWAMPVPTEVTYTVANYTPTVSGKGVTEATVVLLNDGGVTPALPETTVRNGVWTSTAATPWGPTHERNVHIRQGLSGQWSAPWVTVQVTIPPLAPVIMSIVDNELSPTITGTCWTGVGVVVNLVYSDDPTVHNPTVTNGGWTFRRTDPFAHDVTHTVTVTQTVGPQTSASASKTFSIPLPKLVITSPEPGKDEEVGRDLVVKGKEGVKGATVKIRDVQFSTILGSGLLGADGDWSVTLDEPLAFRPYSIDATQSNSVRESERSEVCTFRVVLLSPQIKVPTAGGDLPRSSIISGEGLPGGRVSVWRQGNPDPVLLLRDIPVDETGHWEGQVMVFSVGEIIIRARQTFEQQTSEDSPPLSCNVVPNAPFMETPAPDEFVQDEVVCSGFGYTDTTGDSVTVALADAPQTVLGSTQVLADRTWSMRITLNLQGGHHSLIAVQSRDGFESAPSAERSIQLGSYPPRIDVPTEGRWVTDPVQFEGIGLDGVGELVAWFDPDQRLADGIVIAGTNWQATSQKVLRPGGHWVCFQQCLEGTTELSRRIDSPRFEVDPPKPSSE